MGVAEAMDAFQIEVGAQTIVDEPAGKSWEKREVFDGVAATLFVDTVPREAFGTDDVEPVGRTRHTQTGLIGVGDGRLDNEIGYPGLKAGERVVGGGDGGLNGRLADEPAEEVSRHLADALKRYELLAAQVDQPGVKARSILCGGIDVYGEGGRNLAA